MAIKNSLKLKIFSSFMLLTAMLAVAGAVSIYEFRRLSESVTDLLEDNYKSIEASKTMLEALEREDSGVLLLLLGEWEKGREIIFSADSVFNDAFIIAQNNITEINEDAYILKIKNNYFNYKKELERPIVDTEKQGDLSWYKNDIHVSFLETKRAVNELMNLNQTEMYHEASVLKEKSHQAIMPGIVSIIAALVFTFLLNFFISKYFVSPISKLVVAVKSFKIGQKRLQTGIKTHDEIKKLEIAISDLLEEITIKSKLSNDEERDHI